MIKRPTIARTTCGEPRSPRPTNVESLLITTPALIRAIIVINKPIPAVIPSFKLAGILFTKASLNLKSERRTKIIPSIRMAVNATLYEYPIPKHTV